MVKKEGTEAEGPGPGHAAMRLDEREQQQERDLREACSRGDVEQALASALEAHGPEVMRLMATVLDDYGRSHAAFGLFQEDLRHRLPEFRWEGSFRTWAYRLACKACSQVMHTPPSTAGAVDVSALLNELPRRRAEARPWQRTSVRERLRALRESLDPRERLLLLLRVDQRLPWREVARVMFEGDEPPTDEALGAKAIALRRQFQHIKTRLRTLGMEEGLLSGEQPAPR